ncbi:MAG TPA: hypothetical protein VFT12_06460 [Thermoanaerobaculia bacterium]|nr:hypothetical protein [Thermoanaerobaculia bacterium]
MAKDEPQSYGSQADWVKGNVGETVNRQKGKPNSQHGDFYESRHDSEESDDDQGGQISDVQLAENVEPAGRGSTGDEQPARKVTDETSGAKRGGFFKDRDY